ncbi:MAG: hypothetical protein PBU97_18330 [Stenotrophomonas maltophilia]
MSLSLLSSREVEVDGARRPRRLTPKALGVLRVLLRQPGRVVTRDELFAGSLAGHAADQ